MKNTPKAPKIRENFLGTLGKMRNPNKYLELIIRYFRASKN
jgi:hypothetical protein